MKPLEVLKPNSPIARTVTAGTDALDLPVPRWPDPIASEAFHGLAGEMVRTIEPHSEADPAALLVQFLVAFGNMIGRGPYYLVEADRHFTNLFSVIVGATAKGRKGTAWGQVRRPLAAVDSGWAQDRIVAGLSSGEGLIWAVRDPIHKHEPIKEKRQIVGYQDVVADPGIDDKRLLVIESEFASPLQVIRREGNTLSPLVRQAWDTGILRSLTKNNPATATDAHISIVGHITKQELLRHLDSTEAGNGFANRFLWVCARRSKLLPDGGRLDEASWSPIEYQIREAIAFARTVGQVDRDEEAGRIWRAVYGGLSEGHAGLLGAVISRAEAQVIRLASIYALLDRSPVICKEHLTAALAVWEYAEASARFVFGDAMGDPDADEILRALRQNPAGLTRTDIRDLFGRNRSSHRVSGALATLNEHGLAAFVSEDTAGRPVERWFARHPGMGTVADAAVPVGEDRP